MIKLFLAHNLSVNILVKQKQSKTEKQKEKLDYCGLCKARVLQAQI